MMSFGQVFLLIVLLAFSVGFLRTGIPERDPDDGCAAAFGGFILGVVIALVGVKVYLHYWVNQ